MTHYLVMNDLRSDLKHLLKFNLVNYIVIFHLISYFNIFCKLSLKILPKGKRFKLEHVPFFTNEFSPKHSIGQVANMAISVQVCRWQYITHMEWNFQNKENVPFEICVLVRNM